MHSQAVLAFRALKLKHRCGSFAARKFAAHRGVLGLYRIVQQLEAVKGVV